MGALNKTVYEVTVDFGGGVRATDPDELPIYAKVDAPSAPDLPEGRTPLALLVALLAPYHLSLARRGEQRMVEPMVELIDGGVEDILISEEAAREMTYAGSNLHVELPTIVDELDTGPTRSWSAALMRARRYPDRLWVKSRARNPYFSIAGHLLLIEHLAHTGDYEREVVPAAVGLKFFVELFATIDPVWDQLGMGVYDLLAEPVSRTTLAADPRRALAEARRRAADADTE